MNIFVGLSGGVDSSVSAALLQQAGHTVTGVFLRVWQPDFLPCSWREDRTDAKRVCATLGIPFLEIDCSEEYKQRVADYMIREYTLGRTPNPDVMCNTHVKFGVFFERARALGADFVATGHYARTKKTKIGTRLLTGVDQEKDQSYFLWQLPQEKMSHVLFPIGDKQKTDVRDLAEQFGLHTATKKDSQGLCFLGKLDMHDFLKHYVEEKIGDVLNNQGEIIGTHTGAAFLTLGQRHGFTVTKKTPYDTPYYIVKKDVGRNTITVSKDPLKDIPTGAKSTIYISQVNWIEQAPEENKIFSARLRYRQPLFPVSIKACEGNRVEVTPHTPQAFVPAGQSLVLYDGEVCLGGGVIE